MMPTSKCPKRHVTSGFALITALYMILIVSILLLGIGFLTTAHQERATMDARFSGALNLAEAAVNYEFRKISNDPTQADLAPTTYAVSQGTFTVWCTNRDGSTPWDPANYLYVLATGNYKGVTRTIKVSGKGFYPSNRFAIYTMMGTSVFRGSAITITGDIGTNGYFDFSGTPTVIGSVFFDGPNAGWYNGSNPGGYNVITYPRPLSWPTIDDIANRMFPNGGMAWLATHNDNASAGITNNSITSSITLGPGNYYVTNINLKGNDQIYFNNANGPINLWVGPEGGTGTCNFRGGTAAVSMSKTPNVHIYVATTSGINLAGNQEIDACIYAYNKDSSGNAYGYVTNSGNPITNGQIIANKMDINGNITINFVPGLAQPSSYSYYGFDNSWLETTPGL